MDGIENTQESSLQELSALAERDPVRAVREMYGLLRDRDIKPIPGWRTLWEQVREAARGDMPSGYFKRFDQQMRSIPLQRPEWIDNLRLAKEDSVVVLLGAGASAPEPSSIPTVTGLLEELWRRAKRIGREDIDRLHAWCDRYKVNNIEDLLTAAYLANFASKNKQVVSLLDYFLFAGKGSRSGELARTDPPGFDVDVSSIAFIQDALQMLFGLLASTMLDARPNAVHATVASLMREFPKVTVVTTNYDGCIDQAMIDAGIDLDRLVKMHGSINWAYCESCHELRRFDLRTMKAGFEEDTHSFPVLGICRKCGGLRRPLLVPPLSLRFIMFPDLIGIWHEARSLIKGARYLLVVGYSFAEADAYITNTVFQSMAENSNQQMLVFDRDDTVARSLQERMANHIEGFSPTSRIGPIAGDCADTVPKALEALRGEHNQEAGRPHEEIEGS